MDYDAVAPDYGRRYQGQRFADVERAARAFAAGPAPPDLLEVGCGTGHWLSALADVVAVAAGVDPSWGMLERARAAAPAALLCRARAEALPWRAASVDRVLCVNAAHHFADVAAFVAEARRVLRPPGGLMVVGLDPHAGGDQWWVYDYFPTARAADLVRYPSADTLRRLMAAAGFARVETRVAQHAPASVTMERAAELRLLERTSTSQLMVIGDEEYAQGVARVRAAARAAGAGFRLSADLRLYATTGWLAG
ncbi:MAG TPA: methyltransferase domain-containing protein [Gemmatimonadaceae bacterium]|nr:methyltransferase domain-containing protein [Gemmatimonadaceae bacterium]